MRFESFDFAPEILRAVSDCGYQEMTPVQRQAIPTIRRGLDVLASAQTGTGKTAAFALPILQRLVDKPAELQPSNARVLILTPTRELAAQVASNINDFAKYLDVTVLTLVGGGKQDVQAKKLKAGAHIIVATPGRLLEHLTACNLSLSGVECLVLDEADRILDMGFSADVQQILQAVNKERQNLLFSATFSDGVKKLANVMLDKPQIISVNKQNSTADTVTHTVYPVEQKRKRELLSELIGKQNWPQVLVFASTRESCDELVAELNLDGIKSAVVHGDKAQGSRRRALREFTEGKLRVLVATEVAARGLDIPDLQYVVNYDLPFLAEDYVHRIGRTGRAGKSGMAISFVSREEERTLLEIEALIGQKIRRVMAKGYEVGNRDELIKQLQERRRFGKRPQREDNTAAQAMAEAKLQGQRLKRLAAMKKPRQPK
ncbi:TPA: DEAD/DEAH box helicase [Aeromonas salmonicida]|uniref:DEAD/DEAH box helicase n=3 Tax=Aeromonas salmonicida TaxID=645 RepID=UPI00044879CA|nr:DEAD/DEAH box helicase [Aeromonas salmonicida]ELI6405415.1 DEAD/DEAH box helicase [Aeromonas salmonicida subsp. salmonicida]ATD38586.1 RNA helicase [Aeromonas salmonicida subsp. masoucida]ELI6435958.1 DEAD/DEAH box helicase [Aeromonas salmonicida subsp. salmonicida]ELM3601937.1 DEAD/DEAH box helicase [Aeromonas salmonicida subsp. salmonicida]ELM3640377.1 DEAD/DEAH box helicase [Aeromonas salmonicida subsp. salmonicida]